MKVWGLRLHNRIGMWLVIVGFFVLAVVWLNVRTEDKTDRFPVIDEKEILSVLEWSQGESETNASFGGQWNDESPLPSYWQLIAADEEVFHGTTAKIQDLIVYAADFTLASEDAQITLRDDGDKSRKVVDWQNDQGWLEWKIDVPVTGVYELVIDYAPMSDSFVNIIRGVQIDGKYPFREAERLTFPRAWKDDQYPYARNALDNEIRPVQKEVAGWRSYAMRDDSLSSVPLRWTFEAGEHTLRLVGVREPISLYAITLKRPDPIPTYATYRNQLATEQEWDGVWSERIEAEAVDKKSSPSIRLLSVSEPYASPDPKGRLVYNTIGGYYWKDAGQTLEWIFDVPEDGWYHIDLRYFQGFQSSTGVYRTITIDGKVPFVELLRYRFEPNTRWSTSTLADAEGKPYSIYLKKGTHRLAMTVDSSHIRPVSLLLADVSNRLTTIEQNVRMISGNYGYGTGENLDLARVWDLEKYDPQIREKLQLIISHIELARDYILGLQQAETDASSGLNVAIEQLQELAEDVNEIPNRMTVFDEVRNHLYTWKQTLEQQPLQLDYFVVRTPQTPPDDPHPTIWDRIRYSTLQFFRTFTQKYEVAGESDEEALTIWVQRGRDYVDLLQQMIEREFTPATGIQVKLNLIPDQNILLMGNAAGKQPDLALGIGMETPVDYAMRGAAMDLSKLEGFNEVASRFHPGILRSYAYDGGVYGLPETITFNMMYVRTDVLASLGLEPPETWEDVLLLLPTLQERGMTFAYPQLPKPPENLTTGSFLMEKPDFVTPFYQHGASFYSEDGLNAELTSREGFAAFQHWTDWYSKYSLPMDVPTFYIHFISGAMPVGVADISVYSQFVIAAPEISGHWLMLPIPGVKLDDGSIARWTQAVSTSAMIMKESNKKEEAWTFLKWWTSEDVQTRYSLDIESFAGIEYRWYTANEQAFQQLPWSELELEILNEQLAWIKNMPFVPGYYYLPRVMDAAWNKTVLEGIPPREALEQAQLELQREMARKREELGMDEDEVLLVPRYEEPHRREER